MRRSEYCLCQLWGRVDGLTRSASKGIAELSPALANAHARGEDTEMASAVMADFCHYVHSVRQALSAYRGAVLEAEEKARR